MCLSSAYEIGNDGEKLICDRIVNVNVEGGSVRLTTLLGTEKVVEGKIKSIDLNSNIIRIEKE